MQVRALNSQVADREAEVKRLNEAVSRLTGEVDERKGKNDVSFE